MYDMNVDIIPTSTKNSVVGNKSGSIYDRVKRNYEYFCIFKMQTFFFPITDIYPFKLAIPLLASIAAWQPLLQEETDIQQFRDSVE